MDATSASITVQFAQGTVSQGCRIRWKDISEKSGRSGEINMTRHPALLSASATVMNLIPDHTYSLVVHDIEENGMISEVGISKEVTTMSASGWL